MIYLPKEEFEAKALDIAITLWKADYARHPAYVNTTNHAIYEKMPQARFMLKDAGFEVEKEAAQ